MLIALNHGHRIEASIDLSRSAEYRCPFCMTEMVLHAGQYKIAHFVHRPYSICPFSQGETVAHLTAKRTMVNAFRARGIKADLEYPIGDQRADVVAWNRDNKLAVIELQHTALPIEQLRTRIQEYRRRGIPQIWLPFIRKESFDYQSTPRFMFIRDKRTIALGLDNDEKIPDRTHIRTVIERYTIRPFERYLSKINDGQLWFYDETTKSLTLGTINEHETHDGLWRKIHLDPITPLSSALFKFSRGNVLGLEIAARPG